ncbi:unnamed protein product [Timema podura]|uniref:Uncharacterized protein n=1 Tax=Timema podura TaxID=61482 RepID=A0ABN7NHU0_TIMPD|nr:unnamed protein product [Timema podura]
MADLPLPFALSSFAKGRMPFVRAMSMEQRWQDLANLLSLPGPVDSAAAANMTHPFAHHHHHHHYHGVAYPPDNSRSVLLHNATLAPPVGDLNTTSPYSSGSMIGVSNLGSAVATSMNLTNSSEPMGDTTSAAFKTDTNHDMMYYQQNSTPEINQTTDGFLSSILNDEDLQLMDMAMNEAIIPMNHYELMNFDASTRGACVCS